MSEYRVGDRVKVTYEGEVTYVSESVSGGLDLRTDSGHLVSLDAGGPDFTIEKIVPPLPTTPGSVVEDHGCFLVLSASGRWGCPDHGGISRPEILPWDRVVFDAGKAS